MAKQAPTFETVPEAPAKPETTAAPSPSKSSFVTDLLKKLTDNANLGKVVADFGSGLALTVPVLMFVAVMTGSVLMPAEEIKHLDEEIRLTHEQLHDDYVYLHHIGAQGNLHGTTFPPGLDLPAPPSYVALSTFTNGWVEQASQLSYDQRRRDAITVLWIQETDRLIETTKREEEAINNSGVFEQLSKLRLLKSALEAQTARIAATKEALNAALEKRRERLDAAAVFRAWENNIAAIAGLSVVLGVIVSQVNRLLFFEFCFERFVRLNPIVKANAATRDVYPDAAKKAKLQDLVTNHYRYAEGSINMAVAVLCFGLVFPDYAERLPSAAREVAGEVRLVSFAVTALLVANSFVSFRRFRIRAAKLFEKPQI